jgi:hypothetical protein
MIEGPAGIGKTALLTAARGRAAERGMQVFGARGGDLEGEFAHGVVRQLFEQALFHATGHSENESGPRFLGRSRAFSLSFCPSRDPSTKSRPICSTGWRDEITSGEQFSALARARPRHRQLQR